MRFPYGIADFRAVHEDGALYSDCTDRIETVVGIDRQPLLLRAHRFGKSLWLSTLDNDYGLAGADELDAPFGHLILRWSFATVDSIGDAKAVEHATEGRGLDRVFITGVSPVVMADITSGYNFSPRPNGGPIFNSTLALFVFKYFAERCEYPCNTLDNNLAMDSNRIDHIVRLPEGQALVQATLHGAEPITPDDLEHRFSAEQMLRAPQSEGFVAALLPEAQLTAYRRVLVKFDGERLRLNTHALVCIGLLRVVC